MIYHIEAPKDHYESCEDDPKNYEFLHEAGGEYITLGSYDFLIAQARYFA